jgi:glucosamine--fructose-6-phosphate aminotransferase (isomerizing)
VCGIIGLCYSSPRDLGKLLYKGLLRLEYRGYDSAGIAVICERKLHVAKGKGMLRDLEEKLGFTKYTGSTGIGHTRWATHGAPSNINAHPHTDCSGVFAVVHNGIIENYDELKKRLIGRGHVFKSDTDTEVIVHLVEEYYRDTGDVYEAFKRAIRELRGTYAILMITSLEENKIFFAKKDSPLVVGVGDGYNVLASDIPAILDHTRRVVVLRDHWVGYATPSSVYVEDLATGKPVDYSAYIRLVEWSVEEASKGGYPFYMIKEIYEQPQVLKSTIAGLKSSKELPLAVKAIVEANGRVFVTGAGTSYHAAEFYAIASSTLTGILAVPFIASEYEAYSESAREGDVLVAISQSGETMDVIKAVRKFKERGVRVLAVSNVVDSAIPRESHIALYTRAGPEIGVAATKTFLTQTLLLAWLIAGVAEYTGVLSRSEYSEVTSLLERAPRVAEISLERSEELARELAKSYASKSSMYYLSRHIGVPVAREGALKIKEIAYIHAEAYPAGESKHGPIALVESKFPVVFVAPGISLVEQAIKGNIEEMRARGAETVGVVCEGSPLKGLLDHVIEVSCPHWLLTPISHTPPLQLLAYYTATTKGLNPDRPRNLAKTVTVE